MKHLIAIALFILAGCDFSPSGSPPVPVSPSSGTGFFESAARYVETDKIETTDALKRILDNAADADGVEFDPDALWPEWSVKNQPLTDAMRKEAAAKLRGVK